MQAAGIGGHSDDIREADKVGEEGRRGGGEEGRRGGGEEGRRGGGEEEVGIKGLKDASPLAGRREISVAGDLGEDLWVCVCGSIVDFQRLRMPWCRV